ncbi:outer membrane beta-barrel protein [Undibacterium cyanobacteriorum]|uniref:Outer membrane beta-barrel protein n=1 Tax=Undibacterium cyanobacteriorum TaxID=3073561 RepID=A0ABY9RL75_9BURK|nr:outer membrane beta-barrel protein [Undibacterium sp. 20NA77.5]WMW81706.1 outer membrane beta-barrel protein [Undibacterium sp. 20NA77.5]
MKGINSQCSTPNQTILTVLSYFFITNIRENDITKIHKGIVMRKTINLKFLICLALASAGVEASAQMYSGVSYGQTRLENVCSPRKLCDQQSEAKTFYVGYRFNDRFSFEGSRFDLGTFDIRDSSMKPIQTQQNKGIDFSGVVRQPLTENVSAFGKLGIAQVTSTSVSEKPQEETHRSPLLGVGLTYDVSKEFSVRTELNGRRIEGPGGRRSLTFTVGAQYNF